MKTIKIGRIEIEVKDGDYIMFNGSIYQFVTGDMRTLKHEGFNIYTSLRMPNTLVKKINFSELKQVNLISNGMVIKKWFFNNQNKTSC
jgi:hypothetical protein